MRVAPPVTLNSSQRETLQQWARSRSLPARQIERARVVLLAAEGKTDMEIAASLNISNQKAARWRKRFLQLDLAGLVKDAPRPGPECVGDENGDQNNADVKGQMVCEDAYPRLGRCLRRERQVQSSPLHI